MKTIQFSIVSILVSFEINADPDVRLVTRLDKLGVTSIMPKTALNDDGLIVFTASPTEGPLSSFGSTSLYVIDLSGKKIAQLGFLPSSGRTYDGAGISSGPSPVVFVKDAIRGGAIFARKWRISDNRLETVGESGVLDGVPDFESINSFVDMNLTGVCAVAALLKDNRSSIMRGSERPLKVISQEIGTLSQRPQISSTEAVVFRDGSGNVVLNPKDATSIVVADSAGSSGATYGSRPGISTDGVAIGFRTQSSSGAAICVGLREGDVDVKSYLLFDKEDDNGGFSDFPADQRVNVWHSGDQLNHYVRLIFEGTRGGESGVFEAEVVIENQKIKKNAKYYRRMIKKGDSFAGSEAVAFELNKVFNSVGDFVWSVALSDSGCAIVESPQVVFGVDVSKYNNRKPPQSINWDLVYQAGKRFAFVRATDGIDGEIPAKDPLLDKWVDGALEKRIKVGVYHLARFAQVDSGEERKVMPEVDSFLAAASRYIGEGFLPPVLDVEQTEFDLYFTTHPGKAGETAFMSWIRAWMDYVEASSGTRPILYTSKSAFSTIRRIDPSFEEQYPFWIAEYTDGSPYSAPMYKNDKIVNWSFKQYAKEQSLNSDKMTWGTCMGMEGDTDLNSFRGSFDDLLKLTKRADPKLMCIPKISSGSGKNEIQIYIGGNEGDVIVQSSDSVNGPWVDLLPIKIVERRAVFSEPQSSSRTGRYYRVRK